MICEDPLCASLPPPGNSRNCEDNPDQCDYEVEYADGGSSLGVLVKDVFLLNFTNGKRLNPLLALGLSSLICFFENFRTSAGFSYLSSNKNFREFQGSHWMRLNFSPRMQR